MESVLERRAAECAHLFGTMVRDRRRAMNLSQEQLSLISGVGRRFIIDLEAGKATCQLGLTLVVAETVGLNLSNIASSLDQIRSNAAEIELPPLIEDEDENTDGGPHARIL